MSVTVDTAHLEISPLNLYALLNMFFMVVTLETSQLERSLLNDCALANIHPMLIAMDTSHLERSALNLSDPRRRFNVLSVNNLLRSVTPDVSQDPIGPCEPLEQSADNLRHSAMAALSSALDLGDQPVVVYHHSGHTCVLG